MQRIGGLNTHPQIRITIFFLHLLTNKYITFQQNINNNNNPNKRQVKRKSQKYKETKMEPLQT